MPKYTLHWLGGRTEPVEGNDIADACRRAGVGNGALAALDHYEVGGQKTEVAGIANCGCVHHAEEGTSCEHDLEGAGLKEKTYDFPVYYTQGGGLAREVAPSICVFVEEPVGSGLQVGDTMPKEWSIIPANELAREQMFDDQFGG